MSAKLTMYFIVVIQYEKKNCYFVLSLNQLLLAICHILKIAQFFIASRSSLDKCSHLVLKNQISHFIIFPNLPIVNNLSIYRHANLNL